MKYTELHRESLGNNNWFLEIELIPENDFETKALRKVEIGESGNEEKDMIERNLFAALGNMSILNLVRQKKNVFALTATDSNSISTDK